MSTVTYDIYRITDRSDLIKFQIQFEVGLEPEVMVTGLRPDELDDDTLGRVQRFAARTRTVLHSSDTSEASEDERRFLATAAEYALGSTENDRDASRGITSPVEAFQEIRQFTEMQDVILSKFSGVSPYVRVTDASAPEVQRRYEVVVPTSVF